MATHTHKKGTRVRVYNGVEHDSDGFPKRDANDQFILKLEGEAVITSLLDVDEYYKVRFDSEKGRTYARFVLPDAAVE